MRTTFVTGAVIVTLGCGGASTPQGPRVETTVAPEAPVGALKTLAKALDSPNATERKKAAEQIARIGTPARLLEQRLQKAIEKETDEAAKAALAKALERARG